MTADSTPCAATWGIIKRTPFSCRCIRQDIMTSSIKPEVHNISQRSQIKIEPRPWVTGTKFWWRSDVQFRRYTRGQTDRQTDKHRHAHHNTPMPLQRGGVIRTVVATDAKRRGDRCQRCDARQKLKDQAQPSTCCDRVLCVSSAFWHC